VLFVCVQNSGPFFGSEPWQEEQEEDQGHPMRLKLQKALSSPQDQILINRLSFLECQKFHLD